MLETLAKVFPECGAKGSRLTVGVWGPGVCSPAVSAHVRARALWQGRWGTVPKGSGGGKKGGGVPKGVQGGDGGRGWGWRGHSGSRIVLFFDFAKVIFFHESFAKVGYYNHYVKGCHPLPPGVRQEKGTREFRFVSGSVPCVVVLVDNHTLHR